MWKKTSLKCRFILFGSICDHLNTCERQAAALLCVRVKPHAHALPTTALQVSRHGDCSFLPRWRGVLPRLSRWLGSAPWLSNNCTAVTKKKTFETRKYNCSKMQCTMKGSVGSTIAAIENNNGTKEELDLWLKFKCGKCMTAWLISSSFCDATAGWTVARMVAYTPNLQTAWCSLSNHPAALYIISHDTVITFSSPTYQCSHCHCRKRNGGLSFPCHRLHRGRCHLAGAFGLEEHSFY